MPDGISFTFDTAPFKAFLSDRDRRMKQAAMYNVRAGGRVVAAVAKAKAPVLKDRTAQTVRAYRKSKGAVNAPVRGLLKASIKPSRRLRYDGVTWSLKVGPRGPRVHLYAAKQEDRTGFMRDAYAAVESQMKIIAQSTYDKVWR